MTNDNDILSMTADGELMTFPGDDEGALAISHDDVDCCCHGAGPPPQLPPVAEKTSRASCNDFCSGKESFTRSECCDCPCPGRKTWPSCWRGSLTGVTVNERVNGTDGKYWLLGNTGPFSFTSYNGANCGAASYELPITEYDANDNPISSGTTSIGPGVTSPFFYTCDTGDPSKIGITTSVTIGIGAINHVICEGPGGVAGTRCEGGRASAVNIDSDVCANPGTVEVRPACHNCDGDRSCDGGSGAPKICANINYYIEWHTANDPVTGDPIFTPETGVLTKQGTCKWLGGHLGVIIIETTPDKVDGEEITFGRCCPDCNCKECDDCGEGVEPENSGCITCWKAKINGDPAYLGEGSCPPTGGAGGPQSGIVYKSFDVSGYVS